MEGYDKTQEGLRIDNIPRTGVATGRYFTDFYGCWWEIIIENYGKLWIIGNYP